MTKLLAALFIMFAAPALATTTDPAAGEPQHVFQLTSEDAEKAISDALATQGAGAKIAATIIGHNKSDPLFSHGKPITVELRGLTFDKSTRRWSTSLMAVSGEEIVTAMPLSGRFEEIVEVPVLKRQIRSGELISEDDLEMRSFPVHRTRAETVTDMKELIGQSPMRTLSTGRPIRSHEISGPVLVKKDSIVQMRYSMPGMEISATGQAMEEGSKGRMIAVRNLASKKVVHALVDGENTVMIKPVSKVPNLEARSQTGEAHATN